MCVWLLARPTSDEAAIKHHLSAFSSEANESIVKGLGLAAHAAAVGSYFTDDVVVDLGHGSAPIHGRETVVGMVNRLQPRIAAFQLKLEDVGVVVAADRATAEVHLTAEFIRRSASSNEPSMDAREFMLGMRLVDGVWKIARVTAVDTLK
jgi:ketosteroid isomerase-like protein